MATVIEPWIWVSFTALIIGLLLVDMLIFHRKAHVVTLRESLGWTAVWIILALIFGGVVWIWLGPGPGLEYYTGYLIEKSLSVDNLFVFLLIFTYFSVPKKLEHTVLFWGILGALVFRGLFIFAGVALLERFAWLLLLFGIILIVSAIRMGVKQTEEVHPERNPVFRLFRRFVPITLDYMGNKFLVRWKGRLFATPLLVVLLTIETTDIVFALDSIPAIFGITIDPFIIFTSNAFAILGLRALYFALENTLNRLHYLHYGLAALLGFIGAKIVAEFVLADFHLPVEYALGITGLILTVTIAASVLRMPPEGEETPKPPKPPIKLPKGVDPLGPTTAEKERAARKEGTTGEEAPNLHPERPPPDR